jgi:hypothetical protein
MQVPYMLEDLVIDRVDLVDEGANSASFIQIYKRKEREDMDITEVVSKMKPEHAEVIQKALDTAAEELAKATTDLTDAVAKNEQLTEDLQKATDAAAAGCPDCVAREDAAKAEAEKAAASFDEAEVVKALPEAARELFAKERAKREAAEDVVRKAKEAEDNATAVAKAAVLKALPIEQAALVDILKTADDTLVEMLTTVATAIEGTVLGEVGKAAGSTESAASSDAAWEPIDKAAEEFMKSDAGAGLTKPQAITAIIKTRPELYNEYLKGGAK